MVGLMAPAQCQSAYTYQTAHSLGSILAVLGSSKDLHCVSQDVYSYVMLWLTFVHPGYSQACTFFPFFALLMRCVVGVYVISSAGFSSPGVAIIPVPRDDPP